MPIETNERLSLLGLLALATLLFACGLDWGLPAGWDFDEIQPVDVTRSLLHGVASGWPVKYPPFHFYLLAPLHRLVHALPAWTSWSPSPAEMQHALFRVSRGLSVVMGVATVWLTCLAARRIVGARGALYAGAVVTLFVPMVFYSKLGNLDVPYLFWVALSLWLLLRLLERHRHLDYLLVAAAAAAAVATKDQAYGVYVLAPFVILVGLFRQRRLEHRARPALGMAWDARPWIALAGGLAVFATAHQAWTDPSIFLRHFDRITGRYPHIYDMYPPTLAGRWEGARLMFRNVQFGFGWPLLVACLAGIGIAFARRRFESEALRLWTPLVLALSYYASFLSAILFQYDRFYLPWAVLLAPYAGLSLAAAAAWRVRGVAVGRLAVALVLAYSAARAATIDLHMLRDARYAAERWLAENVAPGESVAVVGQAAMTPRVGVRLAWSAFARADDPLAQRRFDWLVVNGRALWVPRAAKTHGDLLAGRRPYRRVVRIESRLPIDLLDRGGITSSLVFVNPPIDIFRRVGESPPPAAPTPPAEASAE